MIPSIVEQLGHVPVVAVLYAQGRHSVADATAAGPDLLLALLFIMAFCEHTQILESGFERLDAPCGRPQ